METSIKTLPKSLRDIAYYRQRYRNRVFHKIVEFISEESERRRLTQKDIANILGKDPALISRLLKESSNLTLDTISDLLLAFDAEAEPPNIELFENRRPANFMHPLIARILDYKTIDSKISSDITSKKYGPFEGSNSQWQVTPAAPA